MRSSTTSGSVYSRAVEGHAETRVYKKGLGLVEFEAINPDGTEFTYSVST